MVSMTSPWFSDRSLEAIAKRYRPYAVEDISYATVRDFVDSYEHLRPLATAQGDLKDVQRPWVLKAILAKVPRGGRLVEIGGGQPFVADLLARLGYEVWLVDPYDGSGNGPLEFEQFQKDSPNVRFVRDLFSDRLLPLPPGAFDCVYSISVLEHVEYDGLRAVVAGMKKFLKPKGWSVHAVDHVHRGRDAKEHFDKLGFMVENFGLSRDRLNQQLRVMSDDTETYYLSAESHNRWRGNVPYDDFPMRVCVSVQLCSSAEQVRNARVAL